MDCDRASGRTNSCTFGGQRRTGVWDTALSFRNWWSETCGLVGQGRLARVLRGGWTSLLCGISEGESANFALEFGTTGMVGKLVLGREMACCRRRGRTSL